MKNEYLCRLHYMEVIFGLNNKEKMTSKELKNKMLKIEKKSKSLSINEIRGDLYRIERKNMLWFYRFKGKSFTKGKIKPERLIVERYHHKNLDGIHNAGGKRIIDIKDAMIQNPFVSDNLPLFKKHLPVIVEKYKDGQFEILSGNHRTLAYIKKNYSHVPVVIAKQGNLNSDISSSFAKLGQRALSLKNIKSKV